MNLQPTRAFTRRKINANCPRIWNWSGDALAVLAGAFWSALLQVTPHMRILVALEPVDFRAGIDALVGVCRQRLSSDPFNGGLLVFANRRRSAIKILAYDGNGFWLCQKRLSSGRFAY